ncbi:site-specific DNA-methyltransferase [Thermus brockianus]|uniref:site-specific DNA-methyltransferase n=1 Tax=Thermus brockianus TaxID=56956 RepID=UPI001FCA9A66|nr:site-specific DNA-methyltransferase [Thermus brockianus]
MYIALHIHERISTKAILRAVQRRGSVQLDLFGETPLSADQEFQFYQHKVNWANRLILGDSLLVMNSLLVKESMAGKVQMIYMDPPYGIKYASNFQPRIDLRDVKDKDEDLTREPEQIKAYRDTWKLGIHSYLTYLRDRLLLCRELLAESGSIFVQINDENLHLVRCLLDEVFGRENSVAVIPFRKKTMPLGSKVIEQMDDFILWYAKRKEVLKYRQLFVEQSIEGNALYKFFEQPDYGRSQLREQEIRDYSLLPERTRLFRLKSLMPSGPNRSGMFSFDFQGKQVNPPKNGWSTDRGGMNRLAQAERLEFSGETLNYTLFADDYPVTPLTAPWQDTTGPKKRIFAVQTGEKVIERCILMTTDPGDLVFDPTCGSGTTAYCAEKWGRRWITCDTSRVALAIARQRLMTAKFDYYELRDPELGPAGGFFYETVPHITLESIAKNTEIDAIAAKYQPQIDQTLAELNAALKGKAVKIVVREGGRTGQVVDFSTPDSATFTLPSGQVVKVNELLEWEVPREVPHPVWPEEAHEVYWKLHQAKQNAVAANLGEVEEWLHTLYRLTGHRWESLTDVPDPMPPQNWPEEAKAALRRFWELKRKKRQEIDESIQRNAPQETLYDRPKVVRGIVRVTGPFTVEAIPVPAVEDPAQTPIPPLEEEEARARVSDRGGDYLTTMIQLLKQQGSVLFPGGRRMELQNIRPLNLGYLHAEAEATQNGNTLRVAISFGPQYGPVTAFQVQEAIPTAKINGYQLLLFAGFSFDTEAQALIQKVPVAGLEVQFVNVAPDVLVGDLLKTTRASQIFTVFGQPDVRVEKQKDGTYVVELRGVDIYDPLTGEVHSTRGENVAAWFLDTDYDGKTFHICQAFFPGDPDAWEKLQRALKAQIDPEVFEKMRGTVSFPFQPGEHNRIAVKVIDFRGNEVVRVLPLGEFP